MRIALFAVVALLLGSGCIDWNRELSIYCANDGGGCTDGGEPLSDGGSDAGATARLQVIEGSPQSAAGGEDFPNPMVVQAVDDSGAPVAALELTASCPSTPPSCLFGGEAASVVVETDAQGLATLPAVTAGDEPGTYSLMVNAPGYSPAAFELQNLQPTASELQPPQLEDAQRSTTVMGTFPQPFVFTVIGSNGAPLEGVTVRFELPMNDPTARFATLSHVLEATSAADGTVSSGVVQGLRRAGTFSLTAEVLDAEGTGTGITASVDLTLTAGPPAAVQAVSGSGQVFAASGISPQPLLARLVDAEGNPVAGRSLVFANGAGAAQCVFAEPLPSEDTLVTDENGEAEILCRSAPAEGPFSVTASLADDFSIAAAFHLDTVIPDQIVITSGDDQGTTETNPFEPLQVQVLKSAVGVPGAVVTFQAPESMPTVAFDSGNNPEVVVTDADGSAASSASIPDGCGHVDVTASVPGVSPVIFDLDCF